MTHRVYGKWAGNPKGTPENTKNCVKEIFGANLRFYQCQRKRGHGLYSLYCKQHAKMEPNSNKVGDAK